MDMKLLSLEEFCALTASNEPAPGGGSVSALAGALAASLSEMVACLTAGKKGYEQHDAEMDGLMEKAAGLRARLLEDITRDSMSFNEYMEALTLPKGTDEEKAARREAMQTALKHAAQVPLEVAKIAAETMPLAARLAEIGNKNALTDALVAAMMCRSAVLGALYNVKINLSAIKDDSFVASMQAEIQKLEADIKAAEAAVLAAGDAQL